MDVDAGRILEGRATLDEVGREIYALVLRVARGAPTKSEALGHQEFILTYKASSRSARPSRLSVYGVPGVGPFPGLKHESLTALAGPISLSSLRAALGLRGKFSRGNVSGLGTVAFSASLALTSSHSIDLRDL